MNAPDGMGADLHRERVNMSHEEPDPTHDIVAVDSDGEVLYDTEAFWDESEAHEALPDYNQEGVYDDQIGQEVDHFEVRER